MGQNLSSNSSLMLVSHKTISDKESCVSQNIDNCFLKIQQINEPLVQKLIEIIKTIKAYEIQNFSSYKLFNTCEKNFQSFMTEFYLEFPDERSETYQVIEMLDMLTKQKITFTRVKFIEFVLTL